MHPVYLLLSLINIFFLYLLYNDLADIFGLIYLKYFEVVCIYLVFVVGYWSLLTPYADINSLLELDGKKKLLFAIVKTLTIIVFTLLYYLTKVIFL